MRRIGTSALLTVIILSTPAGAALAQGGGMGAMMGMGRDSATRAQILVFHELVVNNTKITRAVTNLPNGIRTVTQSSDPRLAQFIKDHVVTMDQRIVKGDDPNLPMESEYLRQLFRDKDKIRTSIEETPTGTVVVQTSSDSSVVVALQKHAAEVTDLVTRGRVAMHEAMMKNMPGMRDTMPAKPPISKP